MNNKWLVNFLKNVEVKQIFFGVWFLIAAMFIFMIYAHQRRLNRRNFKPQQKSNSEKNKTSQNALVVKENDKKVTQKKVS